MAIGQLERAIIKTLAFAGTQNLAWSAFEIHKWLITPVNTNTLVEVDELLRLSPFLALHLNSKHGLYSLKEFGLEIFDQRGDRYIYSQAKLRKAERVSRWLRLLPGVEAVFICNSLAWLNANPSSDLDFFILTKPGKLWGARLIATTILKLLRARPGEGSASPICLSFWHDTSTLDLSYLAGANPDYYLAFWLTNLWPCGVSEFPDRLWSANHWVKKIFPNAWPLIPPPLWTTRFIQPLAFYFPDPLAYLVSQKFLPPYLRALANQSTDVVISPSVIKLHLHDRRAKFAMEVETITNRLCPILPL